MFLLAGAQMQKFVCYWRCQRRASKLIAPHAFWQPAIGQLEEQVMIQPAMDFASPPMLEKPRARVARLIGALAGRSASTSLGALPEFLRARPARVPAAPSTARQTPQADADYGLLSRRNVEACECGPGQSCAVCDGQREILEALAIRHQRIDRSHEPQPQPKSLSCSSAMFGQLTTAGFDKTSLLRQME